MPKQQPICIAHSTSPGNLVIPTSRCSSLLCQLRPVCCAAGQQQLLALARVLLQKPRLVLLDECDAALDASSAAAVRALLASQLPEATILQVHTHTRLLPCICWLPGGHAAYLAVMQGREASASEDGQPWVLNLCAGRDLRRVWLFSSVPLA